MVQYNSKTIIFHKQGENTFPREIELRGQWECALVECGFRKSWDTLPEDQSIKLLYYSENTVKELTNTEAVIPKGEYAISDLVSKINGHFENKRTFIDEKDNRYVLKGMPNKKIDYLPHLRYDERRKIIHQFPGLVNGVELIYLSFDRYLGEILGFPVERMYERAERKFKEINTSEEIKIDLSKESFNIQACKKTPFELVYVTADMIEYSLVDNKYVNLMRILKIPKMAERNEFVHYNFETPIYFNVSKQKIESINLNLNTYINSHMTPIENTGDFFFILHFRRIPLEKQIVIETAEGVVQAVHQTDRNEDQEPDDPFRVLAQKEGIKVVQSR